MTISKFWFSLIFQLVPRKWRFWMVVNQSQLANVTKSTVKLSEQDHSRLSPGGWLENRFDSFFSQILPANFFKNLRIFFVVSLWQHFSFFLNKVKNVFWDMASFVSDSIIDFETGGFKRTYFLVLWQPKFYILRQTSALRLPEYKCQSINLVNLYSCTGLYSGYSYTIAIAIVPVNPPHPYGHFFKLSFWIFD